LCSNDLTANRETKRRTEQHAIGTAFERKRALFGGASDGGDLAWW
jgi:hypothetical protein